MVRSSWCACISMLAPCLLLCAGSHAHAKAHNSQTLIDEGGKIVSLHAAEDVVSHAPTKQKGPFSKFAHTTQQRDAEAAQDDELDDDDREDELVVDEQEQWDAPAVGRESEESTKSNRSMMDRAAMMRKPLQDPKQFAQLDMAVAGKSPRRRRQNCVMHGWGAWANCNKACGGGKQSRSRGVKTVAAHGALPCPGSTETKDCNQQSCCAWTNWGPWGHCSKTCGGGKQERIQNHNGKCEGEKKEDKDCNTNPCPVHCAWDAYEAWGKCDNTCGGGKHSRTRKKKVTEAHGGKCEGSNTEEKVCNEDACPTTTTTTTTTTAAAVVLPKSGCIQAAHASLALLAFIGVASP